MCVVMIMILLLLLLIPLRGRVEGRTTVVVVVERRSATIRVVPRGIIPTMLSPTIVQMMATALLLLRRRSVRVAAALIIMAMAIGAVRCVMAVHVPMRLGHK